jgi:hypothetical protein
MESSSKTTKKRIELPLRKKIAVIKASESGRSQRDLAKDFGIGKTQVGNILKRRRELEEAFERNEPLSKRRCSYTSSNDELNDKIWRWFSLARSQSIPVSGPMIQEKAREFAKKLGKTDFKASNGWLESFKKRHNISCAVACGESASVNEVTVTGWTSRLPDLCREYDANDIFNMDETGVFFRALPERTLAVRGTDCHGGKRSKERLTIVLCCSWTGEMMKPLVIGKSKNPRCFRNLNKDSLPVVWKHNKKAWMTSDLFQEWLQDLNRKMRLQRRHILLFIDNAPSHPQNASMSNVQVIFFPPNTTSKLQPLDQGIIQNFKVFYRKSLLRHVLSKVAGDQPASAADVTKSITVLHACQWVASASSQVKPSTITNCFHHAGFSKEMCSLTCAGADTNGEDSELNDLISATAEGLNLPDPLLAQPYLALDADIPANEELSESWAEELLQQPYEQGVDDETDEQGVGDETDGDEEPDEAEKTSRRMEITSLHQALHYAQQLKLYSLEADMGKLYEAMASSCTLIENAIVKKHKRLKQTIIDGYVHEF